MLVMHINGNLAITLPADGLTLNGARPQHVQCWLQKCVCLWSFLSYQGFQLQFCWLVWFRKMADELLLNLVALPVLTCGGVSRWNMHIVMATASSISCNTSTIYFLAQCLELITQVTDTAVVILHNWNIYIYIICIYNTVSSQHSWSSL